MQYQKIVAMRVGALTLLWLALLSIASAQQGQPPQTIHIYFDYAATEPEARDIGERLRQVDAVIVARVAFSEVRAERSALSRSRPPSPLGDIPDDVRTENVLSIVEVLKGHAQMPASGATIRISQPLGATIWNGKRVVHEDGKAKGLQRDTEYVLLLEWNPYANMFEVRANDIFRISSGHVETPSSARYGVAQAGAPKEELLTKLRAAAAQLPKN
jgi:hypothetical protein